MTTMKFAHSIQGLALSLLLVGVWSCQQPGGESTGSEFIPDMAHSTAVEANVYNPYFLNTFEEDSKVDYRSTVEPRLPVKGTIPRGYAGVAIHDQQFSSPEEAVAYTLEHMQRSKVPYEPSAEVPYYYPDTEEGRAAATAELLYNPFPITAKGLEKGKELYDIYCSICHGEKGDGLGYIASEENPYAVYPAAPANFLLDDFVNSSNGRFYHAIMYGKNVMGSYADKLSYEERWQVIHWIRALQAKEKKLTYDEQSNTLNPEFGVPMAKMQQVAAREEMPVEETPAEEPAHGGTSSH